MHNHEVVNVKLQKELDAHRLAGPRQSDLFSPFRVCSLGVVHKKSPGEFRLIHHLSFPKSSSVNDDMAPQNTSVSYATIEDAIRLIKNAGQGCFLAKTDIKDAFRSTPIHVDEYSLLGIKWRGLYYYDPCMPMGCSSFCKTFDTFSTEVEWIARHKLNISLIVHLSDDLLIVVPIRILCKTQLDIFLDLCTYLGIPMTPENTFWPIYHSLSFAGIDPDSQKLEPRLPREKIEKCTQLLSAFLRQKKATLSDIQSLTGLLNFACLVVVRGRAFLVRLIDLTIGVTRPHHPIRLLGGSKSMVVPPVRC